MQYVVSGAVSLMIVLTAASAGAQDKKAPEPKAIERGQKVYADQMCSMCQYTRLSKEDLSSLVAYLRTLDKKK